MNRWLRFWCVVGGVVVGVGANRVASAAILGVGPGKTYATITSAIEAASSGDTVLVHDGVYQEKLVINKPLRLEARHVGRAVIDGGGTSQNLIDVYAQSYFYGLVLQNARGGIVSGAGMPTAADYTAERIVAKNFSGSAFGVNTLGPRIGTATVNNSTIVNSLAGFQINDGDRILARNNIMAHVNNAYVIQNGNAILPSHNLLFDVTNREACGPICGTFGADAAELTSDPLFVDEAGMHYFLQPGSPAIDSGVEVGLWSFGAAPDRGAFEAVVPEPSSSNLMLVGAGVVAWLLHRRRGT